MRKAGDIVLIYYMGKPSVYARIEAIEPDIKDGWYQVELLILSIPAQTVRWILKEEYIDGGTFTMGGVPLRLGDVEVASPLTLSEQKSNQNVREDKKKNTKKKGEIKVIDFCRHKKDK